jgi:hypothetical protein
VSIQNHITIKKNSEIRNVLQSNEFMQFIVNVHSLIGFLKTGGSLRRDYEEQMVHPCGTFIEAIMDAIFIDSGDNFSLCYEFFIRLIHKNIPSYCNRFLQQHCNPLIVCKYLPILLNLVSSQYFKLTYGIRKQQKKIYKNGLTEGYVSFHFKVDSTALHFHKTFIAKDKFTAIDGAALIAINQLKELRADLFVM